MRSNPATNRPRIKERNGGPINMANPDNRARDLRCDCDQFYPLLARYHPKRIVIRCRKCKRDHVLVVNERGELEEAPGGVKQTA